MKNNREFLEGIYNKAEILEKERSRKETNYKRYKRFSSVSAIIILIPLLLFKEQIFQTTDYREISEPRIISINESKSNFIEADFIIIGETIKVKQSEYEKEYNYIYTDVIISVDQVLLGDIDKKEIVLRVKGGKVKKEKLFSQMKGEFTKGSRSLLFLYKDEEIYYLVNNEDSQFIELEKDIFIDKMGEKYNLEDVKNNIDRR